MMNINLKRIAEYALYGVILCFSFSKALLEIFVTISIISWLIFIFLNKSEAKPLRQLIILLSTFLIISSISSFQSDHLETSLRGILKLFKSSMILLIGMHLFSQHEKLQRLWYVLLCAFGVIVVDSIIQHVFGYDLFRQNPILYSDTQIRLTGPFQQYGLLASFLIAATPIIYVFLTTVRLTSKVKQSAAISVFIIGLFILYKTHSRGAWLAAFVSWIVYAVITKQKKLLLILILTAFISPLVLPKNALLHLNIERKEQSLAERYQLWRRALEVIKARPLFGCGINTYAVNHQKYDTIKHWRVPGYYAHNGYLQLAAETGLIALALF
ncbi:MAG: hypothetical protein A3J12_11540, partial [Omnitrophica bacterium RIFCSPLOWO2_02_FULL_44_11]